MSKRARIALAIAGLIVILCSASLLAAVLWPLQPARDHATVPPTLFAPPQSLVISLRLE